MSKCTDYWCTIATWATGGFIRGTFARQALPMTWDFAECNPLSNSTGNWTAMTDGVANVLDNLDQKGIGNVRQNDASQDATYNQGQVISTDPPYYDNIGYADLSDFFING